MKIKLASVLVRDQEEALKFYTGVLGFKKKQDMPVGELRWLTVVSPDEPEGAELVLEPIGFPPAQSYQKALFEAGIPLAAFAVRDVQKEYERLKGLGVVFQIVPEKTGPIKRAVFDDTCGNLIQIYRPESQEGALVARASITINAPRSEVWDALVNPEKIARYMFGTKAVSDWMLGSPIVWKGLWQGKEYEDKGVILKLEPERVIQYSHFSPLAGQPDLPENYHIVTIELSARGKQTLVSLSQDNNATREDLEHSVMNWNTMLEGLKKLLEK